MKLQLIRHATLRLQYAGIEFLVDPMFSDAGVNPPVINTANTKRNPLVSLPSSYESDFLPQAVLVSHLHPDHWDESAAVALPKSTPILCQPGDEPAFHKAGFSEIAAIEESIVYKGVAIYRTGGQHGTGEIGQMMGNVSGFMLKAEGEPTLYIAGDTIWCDEVREALDAHHPEITVVNAGGARFVKGDPITMDGDDIVNICGYAPYTKVVAVHMDAINHCLVTREDLRERLVADSLVERVAIPEDGEWLIG
ncbi:MBL fold metallo-hydrolase [Paenibacillus harenae]|uniref:MBL fold metallo-hydrolase n=1 Tax=Paenibacillus harenae TaxID=306543 RepID=UPI0027940AE4|nr:MBL fold metallo-hydrolase [Paenibacillus harenae]MDQ0062868.1 L-ascorbate metabolism protein UlaG (beta-lactamase superfamily) [Paenibacillus harenae]